jgi:hypothetical protein
MLDLQDVMQPVLFSRHQAHVACHPQGSRLQLKGSHTDGLDARR